MRKRLGALIAACVVAAALAAPVGAITYNAEEDFVHDYVGLIVFYQAPDESDETGDWFSHRCSGTLISPTVFVTAGHCTEGPDGDAPDDVAPDGIEGRIYFCLLYTSPSPRDS